MTIKSVHGNPLNHPLSLTVHFISKFGKMTPKCNRGAGAATNTESAPNLSLLFVFGWVAHSLLFGSRTEITTATHSRSETQLRQDPDLQNKVQQNDAEEDQKAHRIFFVHKDEARLRDAQSIAVGRTTLTFLTLTLL